ncbi:hypothetical protein AAEX28_14225 [Lentisphaerota bacterium WC36G]|nr:hypothetical protein LJT99_00980 [Lentisphaerae bacterium WC36]
MLIMKIAKEIEAIKESDSDYELIKHTGIASKKIYRAAVAKESINNNKSQIKQVLSDFVISL